MDIHSFKSLSAEELRLHKISGPLKALWQVSQLDWNGAHSIVEDDTGEDAAWVHAYLHREEGDQFNAAYWYRKAGRPVAQVTLEREWEEMVESLLQKHGL